MLDNDEVIQKFNDFFSTISNCYDQIQITSACIHKDKEWINLITTAILFNGKLKLKTTTLTETPDIKIIQKQIDISDFSLLLEQFKGGELDFKEMKIIYKKEDHGQPYSLTFDIHPPEWTNEKFNDNLRSYFLIGNGNSIQSFIDYDKLNKIDTDLKLSKYPFLGFFDAISKLLSYKKFLDLSQNTCYYIGSIFPIAFNRNDCQILSEKIQLNILHDNRIKSEKIKIGLIQNPPIKPNKLGMRYNLDDRRLKISKKSIEKQIEYKIELPRLNTVTLDAILSYKNFIMDEIKLTIPSDELSYKHEAIIHNIIDKEYSILLLGLKGKGKDKSNDFERAICWLFNLQGLRALYYGERKDLDSEVDIIAFSQQYNYLYPIECTIGPINNKDKLLKLVKKSNSIIKLFIGKYPSIKVQPLLATCLESNEISLTDIQTAGRERIGILSLEYLTGLLSSSKYFINEKDLFEYFLERIPNQGKEPNDFRKGFHPLW